MKKMFIIGLLLLSGIATASDSPDKNESLKKKWPKPVLPWREILNKGCVRITETIETGQQTLFVNGIQAAELAAGVTLQYAISCIPDTEEYFIMRVNKKKLKPLTQQSPFGAVDTSKLTMRPEPLILPAAELDAAIKSSQVDESAEVVYV